jgi:hypothetical protein
MGWFGKKLSATQEAELREFADKLNAVHEACKRAVDDFKLNTLDLYHICFHALTEDRELQTVEYLEVVEGLIEDGIRTAHLRPARERIYLPVPRTRPPQ